MKFNNTNFTLSNISQINLMKEYIRVYKKNEGVFFVFPHKCILVMNCKDVENFFLNNKNNIRKYVTSGFMVTFPDLIVSTTRLFLL